METGGCMIHITISVSVGIVTTEYSMCSLVKTSVGEDGLKVLGEVVKDNRMDFIFRLPMNFV